MPKLLLPLVALLAIGGSAAGGSVYLLTRDETVVEVLPPAVQASATPTPTAASTATATPTPASTAEPDSWATYQDPELAFSFPEPRGLTASEEFFDYPEKSGIASFRERVISFRNAGGVTAFALGIAPNSNDLSLEQWARAYPGWPSEPEAVIVAGEPGLLFPVNAMGDKWPVIYFRHGGYVFSLGGNVYGAAGAPPLPPGISQGDFQRIIDGFSFGP